MLSKVIFNWRKHQSNVLFLIKIKGQFLFRIQSCRKLWLPLHLISCPTDTHPQLARPSYNYNYLALTYQFIDLLDSRFPVVKIEAHLSPMIFISQLMTKSDWFYPLSIKPGTNGTMVPILRCGHRWSAYQSLVFQNNISTSDLQTANTRANSLSKNE